MINENEIKVSVIVPVYNTERYIEHCINSIVNQSIDGYEIIIIDDGSTDNSSCICEQYARENPQIIYKHKENGGASSARNLGIQYAKGKYIYFCDSDDWIESNALEILYLIAESNNLDLLTFGGDSCTKEGLVNSTYSRKGNYDVVTEGIELFKSLWRNDEYNCSPCLLFIRRELLEKNQLRFYEGIIREDELFAFQVFINALRSKCIPDVLFHQNNRENSVMTSSSMLKHLGGLFMVISKIDELCQAIEIKTSKEFIQFLTRLILNGKHYYFSLDYHEQKKERNKMTVINDIIRKYKITYSFKYTLYFIKEKIKAFIRMQHRN